VTLQQYIDEFFRSILAVDSIPPVVKYLFDFFDDVATRHAINDPSVVHVWKTNRCVFARARTHARTHTQSLLYSYRPPHIGVYV